MMTVSVKWQKEVFEAVEIDTSQPPLVFKAQLYALSGVPPERQKIMVKGGMLKDEGEWSKYGVKQGQRLMMMGSADAIPVAPEKAPVFVEDLPEEDQDGALQLIGGLQSHASAGLVNLGNTCYMNSSLQCLHSVPELKTALTQYTSASGPPADASHLLTLAMKDLFRELDRTMRPVTPFRFLKVMRDQYPQFAQQGEQGMYMQQDAEECWTQLVYSLTQRLRLPSEPSVAVMKELFGIEMKNTLKCVENGEESSEKEIVFSMKCHITSEVNQVDQGIKGSLKGELEKVSTTLGRSAVYVKDSLINSLPLAYPVVRGWDSLIQFDQKVAYPIVFDAYDFCTPELKEQLAGPRKALRALEDAKAGVGKASPKMNAPEKAGGTEAVGGGVDADNDTQMQETKVFPGISDGSNVGAAEAATSTPDQKPTGFYDLVAVLTHKGRSADSGHYVAWVKQESGQWVEFDDEKPILRKEEDITALSGGGDWHMAYILVYKARTVAMS